MNPHRRLIIAAAVVLCAGCDRNAQSPVSGEGSPAAYVDSAARAGRSDSLFEVGESYRKKSDLRRALTYHLEASRLREGRALGDPGLFYSQLHLGLISMQLKLFDDANRYFEKARVLARYTDLPTVIEVQLYLESSRSLRESSIPDLPQAIALVELAIKTLRAMPAPDSTRLAQAYSRLASAYYENGKYLSAIQYYEESIGYVRSGPPYELANLYRNISVMYRALRVHDAELLHLRKSLAVLRGLTGPQVEPLRSSNLLNMADFFQRSGILDSALYFAHRSLSIRKGYEKPWSRDVGGTFSVLAGMHERLGSIDSALWYIQASLILQASDSSNMDILHTPKPALTGVNRYFLSDLIYKSRLLEEYHRQDTLRWGRLEAALGTLVAVDSLLQSARRTGHYDDPQLTALQGIKVPYGDAVDMASRLFTATRNGRYLETAFHLMEQSRAAVVKDALSRAESFGSAGLPGNLRQRENKILQARSRLVSELSQEGLSGTRRDSLNSLLVRNDNDRATFQEEVERFRPGYFMARYETVRLSIRQMQNLLAQNTYWMEFMWAPDGVYRLTMNNNTVRLDKIANDSLLRNALASVSTQLAGTTNGNVDRAAFREYTRGAYALYNMLLGSVLARSDVRKLIISADGPLAAFPFEALITAPARTDEVDYHLPYLLNRTDVAYHYSAGTYERQSNMPRHGRRMLAYGFCGSAEEGGLPWTCQELDSIKVALGEVQNTFLKDEGATEASFKREVPLHNIVHLAVHGTADTTNALRSKLEFRGAGAKTEDGELFAYELYDLPLERLDLAVLSACESGVGKVQAGEGMMSVARGFLYAGCPSIVMSLWKIRDKSSMEVMANFYRNLAERKEIDRALADAKRDYLAQANSFNAHPSNWAAFLMVGDTQPVVGKSYAWLLPVIITVLVLVVTVTAYLRRGSPD